MSGAVQAVAKSTLQGKNSVITALPGAGTVSKVLKVLEKAELNIGYLNLCQPAGVYLGSDCIIGEEIRMKISDKFLKADVLVLDGGGDVTPSTLEVIKKLMTDRSIYGTKLPKVKSVVVIFHEDPQDAARKLVRLTNTVQVNDH
jgi:hypothetical protein